MTQRLPTYVVEARLVLLTDIEISAENFEDALARGKDLAIKDFVDIKGNHNDSAFEVVSVSKKDGWRLTR